MNIKKLQEIAKEKGKELLIENYKLSIIPDQIEVFENPKLIESKGEKYKARAILKGVKVSKFTENLNGRIYPRELDEKLIKEKLPEGTLSLADHPEDDGSIKNICGVWHNARLDENFSYGDWYLVGENGDLIKETIDAGGRIGVSRVGFGEFLEDNKTVNPNSYELSRWGDAVISPSQEVYATYENLDNLKKDIKKEQINSQKSDIFEKEITNKIDSNENNLKTEQEKIEKEVKQMDKFTELNHRNQIKETIRKARGNENFREAIETLSTIETDAEDLQKSITEEISKLQVKLEEQKENAIKSLNEKNEEYSKLQEKYDTAVKVIDEFKTKMEKANQIMETLEIQEDEDIEKLKEWKEKWTEEISIMSENVKHMQEDIDAVSNIFENENFKSMEIENIKDITALVEDTIKRDADIEYLSNSLKEAEEHIEKCEEELEKLGFEFDEKKKSKKKEQDDEDEDKKDDEDEDEEIDEKKKSKKKEQEDDDDEDEDDEEEIDEKKKSKKKESSDIDLFISREIDRNPALRDIKKELKESVSIAEVINKIDIFTYRGKDDLVRFQESKNKEQEDEVVTYKVFSN